MRPGAYMIQGDARALPLADASIQCVVTSPPYWGLRDYGLAPSIWGGEDHAHEWGEDSRSSQRQRNGAPGGIHEGRDTNKLAENVTLHPSQGSFCPCGAWRGVLGLEPTPEFYVAHLVEVFREVRRVLRDDGTCWLNLGDSYAASRGYQVPDSKHVDVGNSKGSTVPPGLKAKDLVGIPWAVAFALRADGWWLRSDIVWSKPNPMPESITDRPTKAHEYLFLLTKSARYYYDAEAIKESFADERMGNPGGGGHYVKRAYEGMGRTEPQSGLAKGVWNENGVHTSRNKRSVWTIATQAYPESHFAVFPEKLVEPCILAGTSERGACPACGAPWARQIERAEHKADESLIAARSDRGRTRTTDNLTSGPQHAAWKAEHPDRFLGWSPTCDCPPADPVPQRVLDPFSGSGTTVAVAERLGRVGIGVELKPEYLQLARKRTVQAGLL